MLVASVGAFWKLQLQFCTGLLVGFGQFCAHHVEQLLLILKLVLEVDFGIFTSFHKEAIDKLLLFSLVLLLIG